MNPRIFVQVWCELDPTLNVRVDRQTGAPLAEGGDVLTRVSALGRFGVAAALEIPDAEVIAFSLGDGHEDALRHALATGASRAVQLLVPTNGLDPDVVLPLADWLREQKPDVVIADRVAGRVAARLGWAHLAGLDQLRIEDNKLRAIRQLGRGDCESVIAKLPASVRLSSDTSRLRYISRARMDAVANRPIEQVAPTLPSSGNNAELGPLQLARARTKLGATPATAPASGLDRVSALMGIGRAATAAPAKAPDPTSKTPEQMAEEFVRYLAHHDLLNDL